MTTNTETRELVTLSRVFVEDYHECMETHNSVLSWLVDNVAEVGFTEEDTFESILLYHKITGTKEYPASVYSSYGELEAWHLFRVLDFKFTNNKAKYIYELVLQLEWSPEALQLKLAHF